MPKNKTIIKYLFITVIAILLFGTGFISGCCYSNRTAKELEDRNIKLQESIDNYSITIENLESEGIKLNNKVRRLNEQIVNFRDRLSEYSGLSKEFTNDLGSIHGEISNSRQRIQEVADGLGEIDSGLQSYIEKAENP